LPVFVEVPTGEAEAATAAGTLVGPRDMLRLFALQHRLADVGVSRVMAVLTIEGLARRQIGQDRSDVLEIRYEPHVIIPFVIDFERTDAARDRMLGQLIEAGGPLRVH